MPKTAVARKINLDDVDLGPVLSFLQAIWRVDHALQSKSKRMERSLGLTGPQRFVLRALIVQPGLSAGDMAKLLHLHPSTLTGVLRRLEVRGLLKREVDLTDTRRSTLKVTASGRWLTERMGNTVEDVVRVVLSVAPKGHTRNARTLLQALADALEA